MVLAILISIFANMAVVLLAHGLRQELPLWFQSATVRKQLLMQAHQELRMLQVRPPLPTRSGRG